MLAPWGCGKASCLWKTDTGILVVRESRRQAGRINRAVPRAFPLALFAILSERLDAEAVAPMRVFLQRLAGSPAEKGAEQRVKEYRDSQL